MFDKLSKFYCRVDCVRYTLNDDLFSMFSLKQVMSTFKVTANADLVLYANFVGWKLLHGFFYPAIFVRHI